MWIDYSRSEVAVYHPICEAALNIALKKLDLADKYKVLHHQYTDKLEMDFAIQSMKSGKYLCIIEVKRTPQDVNSARYQYQAMSYILNNDKLMDKNYYLLTNLEYALSFKYDASRQKVYQQILSPGMETIAKFVDCSKEQFIEKLSNFFCKQISLFIHDSAEYNLTLTDFAAKIETCKNDAKKWHSELAIMLYEYIRGALLSIGRKDYDDVRKFRNDIERICKEGIRVNFAGIFNFDNSTFSNDVKIDNNLLVELFELGKLNSSGDVIADVLHQIVSSGKEHDGVVATDIELARLVAVLAKNVLGKKENITICDPAAGSGNLVKAAADILNIAPTDIIANDKFTQLIELLSLRLGLSFATVISPSNSPKITSEDIANIEPSYFKDVDIILLNPPYVAGVQSVKEKKCISDRIIVLSKSKSSLAMGQIGLEAPFLELVVKLQTENTVLACIMPKQYLYSKGKEASEFRKYLLGEFGLQVIFNYPLSGTFDSVQKSTCVFVGKKGSARKSVRLINSLIRVPDIDYAIFSNLYTRPIKKINDYCTDVAGFEIADFDHAFLVQSCNLGWYYLASADRNASNAFVLKHFDANKSLEKIADLHLNFKRGAIGNLGASKLLYISSAPKLYSEFVKQIIPSAGLKNSKGYDSFFIGMGDQVFFDYEKNNKIVAEVATRYIEIENESTSSGKQAKEEKTKEQLLQILKTSSGQFIAPWSVAVQRAARKTARSYVCDLPTFLSTNFFAIECNDKNKAIMFGSYISSIFFQLECELLSKNEADMRKMEEVDFANAHLPTNIILTTQQIAELTEICSKIEFLDLTNPKIRNIDTFWAEVLFGNDAPTILNESLRYLQLLLAERNQ